MSSEKGPIYAFGAFRLIPSEGLFLKDEEQISLTPKAFAALVMLVERRGHLVEKSELIERVWDNAFVEEAAVSRCIWQIRSALGVDSKDQNFIRTVPKRGYRFVAEVDTGNNHGGPTSIALPGPAVPKESAVVVPISRHGARTSALAVERDLDPAPSLLPHTKPDLKLIPRVKETRRIPRYWIIGALVSVSVVSVLGVLWFTNALERAEPAFSSASANTRLAILPLKSISESGRNDLIELGVADSLINRLGSYGEFTVRPLGAVRKYAGVDVEPTAAGQEQGVDYVLAANYQVADGNIKVTAQLINATNGKVEDTYRIEKDAKSVFAVQDAISDDIANSLQARFSATTARRKEKFRTGSEEAYRLYLQGMYFYAQRNQPAARKAVELFEDAVQRDPNYALAWAGKAHAHRYSANLGRAVDTNREYRMSIDAIDRALALDPELSEAYSALCENRYYHDFEFIAAEHDCLKAIALDPNSSVAHEIYGRFLWGRGRFDESIKEVKKAIDLDPASLFNQRNLGISLYYAGRYDEAAAQFKRVIEMDKNFASVYLWLVNSLQLQGKYDEAYEWLLRSQERPDADPDIIKIYQSAYHSGGYPAVMRAHAKYYDEKGDNLYYLGALFHAQIGNTDKAIDYLEKSFSRREWGINSLLVEPLLTPIRDDARFQDIVRRAKLAS